MRLRTALPALATLATGTFVLATSEAAPDSTSSKDSIVAPAVAGQQALAVRASKAGIVARVCAKESDCNAESGTTIELPAGALDLVAKGAKLETRTLVGGRQVVRVVAGGGTGGASFVALLAAPLAGKGDAPITLWTGFTGLAKGEHGEERATVLVEEPLEKGVRIVVGEQRDDVTVCGRPALVSAREVDPQTMTLKRGASVQSLSGKERAEATKLAATLVSGDKPRPLVPVLVARTASSAVGKAFATLTDGDPETTWSEAKTGPGRGEFVTFSSASEVPITSLDIVVRPPKADVPQGAAPKTIYLATPEKLYEVSFPEDAFKKAGARYEVKLPEPIASTCLSLVLDAAYAPESAADARVTIAEITARTAFDESSPEALVGALAGGSERSKGAAALLARGGSAAVKATIQGYDKLDDAGKKLAEGVIDAAPCADQAPFWTRVMQAELEKKGPKRAPEEPVLVHARDRLRRCGRASAASLAELVVKGEGKVRIEAAAELSLIAPAESIPVLVDALATQDDALRRELRGSLAHAAKSDRAVAALGAELEKERFAGRSEVVRIDLLRALGSRIDLVPGARDAFASLATEGAPFRTRYLLLGPAADLARAGDKHAEAFLVTALRKDPDRHVRLRAAEVAYRAPQLLPLLLEAAEDPEVRVRDAAILSLGTRGRTDEAPPATIVTALGKRLAQDPFTFVRTNAARSLGEMPSTKAGDAALAAALGDASPEVRGRALDGLGAHQATAYLGPIRELAGNDEEQAEVRTRAILALAAMCDRSQVDTWTKLARSTPFAMSERERTLGAAAIAALGDIKPQDLRARLAPLLDPKVPRNVRELARAALEATSKCK
ncbi:HEAT repeat domain-containing protein [Polyangium sp. y55x31]|uniref:HEAT repeat domain-containing protein n=1 Tax=Polyangium sp. y55x31 TaxID=3042688 RepID=UPI0024830495|nr:HEAT repeat domain-containing protein [Polyangium sp. y55x31]MDI1477841.1 HEAT repeat domain-containing protein [Polyangium sp. y55x31]